MRRNIIKEPDFMQRALDLAWAVKGGTSPNPAVGAVVVRAGQIVAGGATKPCGGDHAEVTALKKAGGKAKGASLYVTLEPCCHWGRTPPCTDAIIRAGIRRVFYSVPDPNPLVAGKGAAALKKAGIEVEKGLLADEARLINEDFFKFISTGLPFVHMKVAQTWDGYIATGKGDSKWITSENARKQVHVLRSRCDAVLVGIGTVLADNPLLSVRHIKGRDPIRIILDSRNRLPSDCAMIRTAAKVRTIVACFTVPSKPCANIEYWPLPRSKDGISIPALLRRAAQESIVGILVEGGQNVFTSFVRSRCVDKFHFFLGNKLLGGGTRSLDGLQRNTIADAVAVERTCVKQIGNDVLLTGYPTAD